MTALALIALSALCICAQPASTLLPARDSYPDFVALVRQLDDRKRSGADLSVDDGDVNLFQALLDEKRYDAVLMLAKAFKETAPDLDYGYDNVFKNPIALAYKAKRLDLVKKLAAFDPKLVNLEDTSLESAGPVPFAPCVENDDLATLQFLISKGADLKSGEAVHVRGDAPFASNLLTISPSARMTEFLVKQGLPTVYYYDPAHDTTCLDDKVRMRKEASTDAPILAVLAKGEPLKALGYTYAQATIGGDTDRWIFVERKGVKGWVFGTFVNTEF
jgi:hypothetical protein